MESASMRRLLLAATISFSALIAGASMAQVSMTGSFTARQACPATPSIHSSANPGSVSLEANRSYKILGKNKDAATHYLLEVPGAAPARRWVSVSCGDLSTDAAAQPQRGEQTFYVLAASWEPSFCATEPRKPECQIETPSSADASRLSLHGLWPDPDEYCNVPRDVVAVDKQSRFEALPPVNLSTSVRDALSQVMPGTKSALERHEWVKHGTCAAGATPDAYFAAATALMAQLNASNVGALFASNVGAQITTAQIQKAMNDSFGAGAGDRIRVSCKGSHENRMIMEFTIALQGQVDEKSELAELIAAAPPTADSGCPSGLVKAVRQ
jgi:ribonuclease T2